MKLVAYTRVSTDNKGQDTDRQKPTIQARADQEGHEILAWISDEGTSGSISPLDRPAFQEAVAIAKRLGAKGLIVEAVDRFTRGGAQDLGVSMYHLEEQGLCVIFADLRGDAFVVELLTPLMATLAKANRERMIRMVRSGMDNSRRKGWPNGPPGGQRKPDLTDAEFAAMRALYEREVEPLGFRLLAVELNRMRGANDVADPKAARRRRVSSEWMRYQMHARGLPFSDGSTVPAAERQTNSATVWRVRSSRARPPTTEHLSIGDA